MTKTINRSPFMRMASVMTILALLVTCCVSGTMAKYTSSANISDTISVAQWKFTVEGTDITKENSFSFGLFDTIVEDDCTTAETAVSANLIAPGTGGSFAIDLVNDSEVDAIYTIALEETTNAGNLPIQYSLDKTTWYDDFSAINTDRTDVAIAKEGGSETVTVYWRWCFEGTTQGAHAGQTDTTDTALGVAAQSAADELTIKVTVTVTQVDAK